MPCPAWSISPKHCKTGSLLRKQKGTVCSACYACKGHYMYPNVQSVQEKRLQAIKHPDWVEAMVVLIRASGTAYFRWFDSGDIQNPLHFLKIILIAMRMPEVKFWLPTHEKKLVSTSSLPIPDNLTIRVTNPLIDPKVYEKRFPTQSEVRTTMDGTGFLCPASWGPIKHCGSCRACWDKTVPLITYRRH